GVILSPAIRALSRQALDQRKACEQRDFNLAEEFLDAVLALGAARRGLAPEVAGLRHRTRLVVDRLFAIFEAERHAERTGGQFEQLAGERTAEQLLFVFGRADVPEGEEGE